LQKCQRKSIIDKKADKLAKIINKKMKIKNIDAYEILDSRGIPAVEVKLTLEDNQVVKASVPSGASTGTKEALELRDGEERFGGKGVLKACGHVMNDIFPRIKDMDVEDLVAIDEAMIELDGTPNKSKLGANAILGVSLAVARAGALLKGVELWQHLKEVYGFEQPEAWKFPVPMINVINGGEHADSGLDMQEFMLVPSGFETFAERLQAGAETYQSLKKVLTEKGYRVAVGDEGGFAPALHANAEALELILEAIENTKYEAGVQIKTGIDAAASEFYDKESGKYNLRLDGVSLDSSQISSMYREWIEKFKMELIEDPMSEFDWDGWKMFNEQSGEKIAIIADDLTVTNKKILDEAKEKNVANAILIKVNQIGSVTETANCVRAAKEYGMKVAVSHRSGETTDDFIGDLAVGFFADYVKFGSTARGERVCKYNRVAQIERDFNK
jgi:enolase